MNMTGRKSKFSPPMISLSSIVYRTELIENELRRNLDKRYIFIEAQAGQGKTTAAAQFVHRAERIFAWYQVSEEDCDPLFFFSSIIGTITFNLRKQTRDVLRKLLPNSEIAKEDLTKALSQLIDSLNALKPIQLTIVLDDLHLVNGSSTTLAFLDSFLENAPQNIYFLLLSRSPIPLKSRKVKFGDSTLYLTNENLAFSLHETVELYALLGNSSLSYETLRHLHSMTDGWVMGLILAKNADGSIFRKGSFKNGRSSEALKYYFQKELLDTLPERLQVDLLKLSLLDDIPISLGEQITGNMNLSSDLDKLMDQNWFIRITNDEIETYSFHQLMREILKAEFLVQFLEQDQIEIHEKARDYYLTEGAIERAFVYVLRLGHLHQIEQFLEQHGLELVARNRLGTLARIPEEFDSKSCAHSAWLELFRGMILAESDPETGVHHLMHSAALFAECKNKRGRLLALSQVIYHHVLTANCLKEGSASIYLEEATEIYFQTYDSDNLPSFNHIFICRNIGAGYVALNCQLEKSRMYLSKALEYAQKLKIPNMIVSCWVFLGYSYAIPGLFPAARKIAEALYRYILNDDVGTSNKAFAHHFLTDLYEMADDFLNFTRSKARYSTILKSDYISKTQMDPSVALWDIKFLIISDELDYANALIDASSLQGLLYNSAHIKSRMLEFKAFITALSGGSLQRINHLVKESTHYRKKTSWGGFFAIRQRIFAGIALSLAGDRDSGEQLLTGGINAAVMLKLPTLEVSGLMLRSYSLFLGSEKRKALEDLNSGLTLMRCHNYDMFWGWYPEIVIRLFKEGAKADIEPLFIRKICRKKFRSTLTKEGEIIPCIVIQLLGSFQVSIAGTVIAGADDFTPMQRMFLAALVSSPNNQISQEKAHSILWPDIARERAKRNLDTFISRLRSLLRPLVLPLQINELLVVNHGLISLQNCWVDAIEFNRLVKQGMDHVDIGEFWQAGSYFASAHDLWKGCFALDVLLDDIAYEYRTDLRNSYLHMVERWTTLLLDAGQKIEASQILLQAWKIHPSHERITAILYHLYLSENDTKSAKKILTDFKKMLEQQEVSEVDIMSQIETISCGILP